MIRFAVLLAVLVASARAQKPGIGECRDVPVKTPFDIPKYMGKWYEIEKNPAFFEYGHKCQYAVYEDKGDYIAVENKGVDIKTGKPTAGIKGKATAPDKNVPAKLKVQFNSPILGDYWILDTDYENYSVVYSCKSLIGMFKAEYLWILGREKTLDDATKQKLYDFLDQRGIGREALTPTEQDCD